MIADEGKLNELSTRDGFGDGVVIAGERDENVVVLCADLAESTRSDKFKSKFPKRFFETGVAEQNMAGISAGLAGVNKSTVYTGAVNFFEEPLLANKNRATKIIICRNTETAIVVPRPGCSSHWL